MNKRHLIIAFISLVTLIILPTTTMAAQYKCQPTEEDEMGPFYRVGAPLRSVIGKGYVLTGNVKSATDCTSIPSVLIELWQTGPDGRYDDQHRAAIITGTSGHYQFETDFPAAYLTRPPHIHIRVSVAGFQTLTTQHYLKRGTTNETFDLVLIPEP